SGKVRVGRDGANIVLEYTCGDKTQTMVMPWDAALEVARALTARAREVETDVKAGKIINDQALLVRLGIPLGLSNNPNIQKEAHHAAQFDDKLRKYITGSRVQGIPSDEMVGTPVLITHKPKEVNHG
ncbi:MAG: hypothetical protein JW901_09820, partial [Dehalococcoidia bacterium]|nr:hypothetical protein [Dehalococcoidia bacterium]